MSNIYEALEQAQREKNGSEIPHLISIPGEVSEKKKNPAKVKQAVNRVAPSMETEMFCLYQNIEYLLPDTPEKTILFMGLQGGEGVSTIVRDFAKMAAARLGKTVLIMDAAHHNPCQHLYFNIKGGIGWKDIMETGEPADNACHHSGSANLFLAPISPRQRMTPSVYDHPAATGFLEDLKKKYDFILIDSSPAITSPGSIAISRFTDGVVLVMEAERTRWQVVENVRNKIARNGGNVIGIVFNKRKYYIPGYVYSRLF